MGILPKLLGVGPGSAHNACIKTYEKAKAKRPGKDERDYLKLVLLTKPPYDYQTDKVLNLLLDEFCTIENLTKYIANRSEPFNQESQRNVWESRERNLLHSPEVKRSADSTC